MADPVAETVSSDPASRAALAVGDERGAIPAEPRAAPSGEKRWWLDPGTVISLVALAASLISLWFSYYTGLDVARTDALKTEYAIFGDLAQTQLSYPQMSHLFAITGESYDRLVARIGATVAGTDPQEREKLLLQERALAHHIFGAYEQSYFTWEAAKIAHDSDRAKLLRDDLQYFVTLLCNPRLLWYWDIKNGERLGLSFATEVNQFRKTEILGNNCKESAGDPRGPFNRKQVSSR